MPSISSMLSLCVITTVGGFTFEEALHVAGCLAPCQNESCRDDCPQPTGQFEPHPWIQEEARAKVALHCKGMNVMIIKHNPGVYVIERATTTTTTTGDDGTWAAARVSNGQLSIFSNLTADTLYRYRLYRVTRHGVSSAETSQWFSTYAVDYRPRKLERVSLANVKRESKNVRKLRAEIIFEPHFEDRSCNYDVLSWSGEHDLVNFRLKTSLDFRFFLGHLPYDRNNTVSIASANDDFSKVGNATIFTFATLSCLEMHHDLSICAPEKVKGLRAQLIRKRTKESHDVVVRWNRPVLQPDNYTLQIDSLLRSEPHLLIVPGNAIEAFFFDVDLGPRYEIDIVAESMGGMSLRSTVSGNVDEAAHIATDRSYREIIVALLIVIMMIIAAVFLMICLQWNRNGNTGRRISMEYVHLENSTLKKPSRRDYTLENTLLPHDKFQLCPRQLKLKGILGSGAYGVVRLASLRDNFGVVTDVAVKMMRDDPTVEDTRNFHQEIAMMKSAGQHPNIVSLIGYCTLYDKPLLVVEYCNKGDLQIYLRTIWQNLVNAVFERRSRLMFDPVSFADIVMDEGKSGSYYKNTRTIANSLYDIQQEIIKYTENITSADLLSFARQVATGMEFLSANRIVHRDLAARNVLVRSDRVVKISDFGLSRDVYQENIYRKKGNDKLPLKWMAIEALTHQIYTTYSDVWAFGILLWEIVTLGAMPYPDTPTNRILQLLKSGYRMERPPNCGRELYDIMYSCWNQRPQSRPTFAELKQNLDKLLGNYSENKYLNLCEVLQESAEDEVDID